jgi:hypothetical protein
MTKLYITEFQGLAATTQSDSVDIASEPASQTQVINTAATTGQIGVLGAITGGSLYTNGSYTNVPLTGGTGSGATANITVSGGAVTAVTLVSRGTGYTAADSLSAAAANIGGTGSGFTIPVSSITQQVTLLSSTRFIELEADGICSFRVGLDPVATTGDARIPANNPSFRRGIQAPTGLVGAGQTQWKVSAITNT